MKTLIVILSLLTLSCSLTTDKNKQIFIRDIGWTFEIPKKLSFRDSSFNDKGQLTKAIPDDGSSLRLFVVKCDKGSIAAFIRKDTLDIKEWKDFYDKDTEWYFSQIRQVPQMVVLDTKYSNEKVGNTDFLVQYVKYIRKSTYDTGYVYHYLGKLKDKSMDISSEYYDKDLGDSFQQMLRSSSFSD
jgi:hypothetical protein